MDQQHPGAPGSGGYNTGNGYSGGQQQGNWGQGWALTCSSYGECWTFYDLHKKKKEYGVFFTLFHKSQLLLFWEVLLYQYLIIYKWKISEIIYIHAPDHILNNEHKINLCPRSLNKSMPEALTIKVNAWAATCCCLHWFRLGAHLQYRPQMQYVSHQEMQSSSPAVRTE